MDNSVVMAVAMALVYWLSRGMIGGYFALFFIGNPIFIGIISGLIYGDVLSGLMIGGGIAAVFAGIIAPGGNLPTDQGMAAATMIPIALNTGLSVEQAIAFAVPLGLLGAQLLNLRKIINVPLVHKADEYAEKVDTKGIARTAIWYPVATSFLHGLEVAGGILPAVGFALIINSIGKPRLIPYIIIGFICVSVLGMNSLVTGIIAISIAFITVLNRKQLSESMGG